MKKLLIGDFASVKGGKRLPKNHSYSNIKTDFPYLRVKDFGEYTIESSDLKYLKKQTQELISRYTISNNDIYISIAGTIGRVGFIPDNLNGANLTENAAKITDIIGFDKRFLVYYLSSLVAQNQISIKTKSTSQPKLALYRINSIETPLFSLTEQKTIVAKIEELFSSLDSGIADLKKAQDQLVIYRQAVLKKAFEGEWKEVKLEDISTAFGGYAFKSKNYVEEGRFQILRIGNIRPGEIRYQASPVFIDDVEDSVLNRYALLKDDVVISLTGTRTKRDYGYTAIIDSDNLLLNQRIAAIRFDKTYNPKFFLYFSWSKPFKDQFFGSETGNTGQGNVGMKSVKETLAPFPDIKEQHQIVREIESRLSVCDKVEESITESLKKAKALRQSILKKAFEGKLLSDEEIERCKQEKDYEPASVLLEKIKTGKKKK